jgi:hypothetical protein
MINQNLKIYRLQKQNNLKENKKKLSQQKNQKNQSLNVFQNKKRSNNLVNSPRTKLKKIWKTNKVNIQIKSGEVRRNGKSAWKIIYKRNGLCLMKNHSNKKDKKLKLRARILSSR